MKLAQLREIPIAPLPIEEFAAVETPERRQEVLSAIDQAQKTFAGRVIWNVNSTGAGGGVAEMLRSLIAYARGAGIDARWMVIQGDPEFFRVTKRIHNHLHGSPGDGGSLGQGEREAYERTLQPNAEELSRLIGDRDVVLLHDPQTAGIVPHLRRRGLPVVWRCHVGIDTPNDIARNAWSFLTPYVAQASAHVFSRPSFAWESLAPDKTWIVMPSIDAFSPKNRELAPETVLAILAKAGVVREQIDAAPEFQRQDGSSATIENSAQMFEVAPATARERLVLQVSRWDRLKDPVGVIQGFAEHVAGRSDAHLVLAGPAVEAVADDPEGAEVLQESVAAWEGLAPPTRARVHLACLPMLDGEENAAIVNALQRHAYVVVQKSIAEGFGLTVAEAMWKARPVVASRIGGIQDQIEDGKTGLLLDDAHDLAAYGAAVLELLDDPQRAAAMGAEAMHRVRQDFLGDRHLLQYEQLLSTLL